MGRRLAVVYASCRECEAGRGPAGISQEPQIRPAGEGLARWAGMGGERMAKAARSKKAWVGAVLLLGALAFCWVAMLTYSSHDGPAGSLWPEPDPPSNACGAAGAWFAYQVHLYLGKAGYVLLLLISGFTFAKIVGKPPSDPLLRAIGTVLMVVALATAITPDRSRLAVLPELNPGGMVGVSMYDLVHHHFSNPMAMLLVVTSMVVGLLLAADEIVMRSLQTVRRAHWPVPAHLKKGQDCIREFRERFENVPRPGWLQRFRLHLPSWPRKAEKTSRTSVEAVDEVLTEGRTSRLSIGTASAEPISDAEAGHEAPVTEEPPVEPVKAKMKEKVVPRPMPAKRKSEATWPTDLSNFELPPLSLLPDGEPIDMSKHEKIVQEKARILEQTLQDFKVDARVAHIDTGPVITIYELDLAAGVKVSAITSLSNDIARVLRAPAVRVVAPIPGKNTVGVEAPNMNKGRVRLKELIIDAQDKVGKMALPLYLGKDASGDALAGGPGSHAAPADRRHDGFGQERVHQLDHHVVPDDAAARPPQDDPGGPEDG